MVREKLELKIIIELRTEELEELEIEELEKAELKKLHIYTFKQKKYNYQVRKYQCTWNPSKKRLE